MRTTPRSEIEARKAAKRELLRPGWWDAEIREAAEKVSKRGNDTIELVAVVADGTGNDREFRDWLSDSALGAVKLRHACEAIGALDRYETGEISAEDFPGRPCRVRLGIEKKRGYPDRNVIEDYSAADADVVDLRAAR